MADVPILYGPDNQPIRREVLTTSIAGPTITGVRSPFGGYPGDGLNPRRLASILREADSGDPTSYFELAEQIEERDPHYLGVLSTRKRSVSQLDITVEAADDSPEGKSIADQIEAWLRRDELQSELFDILDAIGKGWSQTEIIWDTSSGQWQPKRLEWRDPRWFKPDQRDGASPLLRIDAGDTFAQGLPPAGPNGGGYAPLPPFKFISAVIRAKSGLPIRSGLARLACWSWMFKAFTLRDWAIFTQTFGQPLRVGKFPAGSSEENKNTLFRAVANIAGDCAAIIPETMVIEFVEAANVGASHQLYKERADWLDQQMSKAVLGQTATTDAIAGGHAVGQEHRQVQEDIETADAKALAAILNRDLVQAWVQLERGPQKAYPRLRIGRPESRNVTQILDGISRGVPMGMQVEKSYLNDLLGIPVPSAGADGAMPALLTPSASPSPFGSAFPSASPQQRALAAAEMIMHDVRDPIAVLSDQAARLCAPGSDALVDEVRGVIESSTSLQQVQEKLRALKPGAAEAQMAGLMRMARVIANLTGQASITDA
jgi:phage gp29-like protein